MGLVATVDDGHSGFAKSENFIADEYSDAIWSAWQQTALSSLAFCTNARNGR